MRPDEAAACEAILRALPDWFGIESSIVEYRAAVERLPTWVVRDPGGAVAGLITIERHFPEAAEIHLIAVHPGHHRRGIGRDLVAFAERHLAAGGVRLLQVKTLGPSRECAFYARTRLFYGALGFLPLQETTAFWGEVNPTLVMVKPLGRA